MGAARLRPLIIDLLVGRAGFEPALTLFKGQVSGAQKVSIVLMY